MNLKMVTIREIINHWKIIYNSEVQTFFLKFFVEQNLPNFLKIVFNWCKIIEV